MSVSDNFNLKSRAYMGAAGLLGLTVAFIDVSQAAGAQGLSQYYFYAHGIACLMLGGGLTLTSLSGFRAGRELVTQPIELSHRSQLIAAPPVLYETLTTRARRNNRLADGSAALVFAGIASQMDPAAGGDLLKWAMLGYGAGSMIGVAWDTAKLRLAANKAKKPNAAP